MKKLIISMLSVGMLSTALLADKLKITTSEVLPFKISNEQPTVVNFNFYVKKIKKIFNKNNKTQVRLLDKGIVIIPDSKKTGGIIVVTNEKGTSYTLSFKAEDNSSTVVSIDDVTYSSMKTSDVQLETQNVDRDVSKTIKLLDNMEPNGDRGLSGYELKKDEYRIYNKEKTYHMTRVYRYTGKKYVVDSWVLKNITQESLVFKHRDFGTRGVIAASIQPKVVYPGESASLYIFNNKSTLMKDARD